MGETMRRLGLLAVGVGALACEDAAVAPPDGAPGPPLQTPDAGADAPVRFPARVPRVPIGLEALRRWDRLPLVRIGSRTLMRSTFDRSGGNEGADASHFVRQAADGTMVAIDVPGPGVVAFVRTNHWHGSPWHYVVDGRDTIVSETTTADPLHPVEGSTFLPQALFPRPLAETWSTTRGADLSWVPIAFQQGFELRYGRSRYGTNYSIIHRFAEGNVDTEPALLPWDGQTPPDADVVALLARAGSDVAPAGPEVVSREGVVTVEPGAARTLATLEGPAIVRAIELSVARDAAATLEDARLRITWDDAATASVDAPLPLLFGTGTLYNRDQKPLLVAALLMNVRFGVGGPGAEPNDRTERVTLASYFPMPFSRRARIELVAGSTTITNLGFRVRTVGADADEPSFWSGQFHATYRDHGAPTPGEDLVVLDTAGTEGSSVWCGTFAGMSWTFSDRGVLSTLEGDPRFFFDDSASPQGQGTGTEEWGGGGDYWGGVTMTLPFAGHPVGAPSPSAARDPRDLIESAYRVLVGDAMPFGRRAIIRLEHGGNDDSTERYRSVAYWYGQPGACLVGTDALHVGDVADEAAHGYVSPQASAPTSLTSAYELGVTSPASTDTGRQTTTSSELTLRIDPDNVGVLLRRKLDLRWADQRALVEIADADVVPPVWRRAGVWYTPGSDQAIYSNPPGELDPHSPVLQTSERRFREDEFLVARALTEGLRTIRVRLTFLGGAQPMLPGEPPPASAWSELRYWAYSWVLPPRAAP